MNFRGFSLIEIMVVIVIVIVGMMMGVVGPVLMDKLRGGELTRVKTDFSNIKTALLSYEMDNFAMPTTEQGIEALVKKTDLDPTPRIWPKKGYLDKLPKDPWGRAYIYFNEGDDFELYTFGRNGQEGGEGADKDLHFNEIFE